MIVAKQAIEMNKATGNIFKVREKVQGDWEKGRDRKKTERAAAHNSPLTCKNRLNPFAKTKQCIDVCFSLSNDPTGMFAV